MLYVYVSTSSYNWLHIYFIPSGIFFLYQYWNGIEIPWQTQLLAWTYNSTTSSMSRSIVMSAQKFNCFYKTIVRLCSIYGKDVHWAEKTIDFWKESKVDKKLMCFLKASPSIFRIKKFKTTMWTSYVMELFLICALCALLESVRPLSVNGPGPLKHK